MPAESLISTDSKKSKKAKMHWEESPVDKLLALQAESLDSVPRIYRHRVMHF